MILVPQPWEKKKNTYIYIYNIYTYINMEKLIQNESDSLWKCVSENYHCNILLVATVNRLFDVSTHILYIRYPLVICYIATEKYH